MDSALTKGTFFGSRGWGYYISHYYTPNNFPKETPKSYTFAGLLPACFLSAADVHSNHRVHLPLVNMASKKLLKLWLEPVTPPKDQSNKPSASMRFNIRRASSSVEGTTLRILTPFFSASLPTEKVKWNVLEISLFRSSGLVT